MTNRFVTVWRREKAVRVHEVVGGPADGDLYTRRPEQVPAFILLYDDGHLRRPTEEDGPCPLYVYRNGAYRWREFSRERND